MLIISVLDARPEMVDEVLQAVPRTLAGRHGEPSACAVDS
jgi:hypothetical protein